MKATPIVLLMSDSSSNSNNAPPSTTSYMAVRDLKPGSKNMNVQVMILEQVKDLHRTKEGLEVRTFKVADKTASVNLCIFGEHGKLLKPGDICRVLNGYCSLFRGYLTAYVGKNGQIKRVGEFTMLISEDINISEIDFEKAPNGTFPPAAPTQPPSNQNRPLLQDVVPCTSAQHNFSTQRATSGGGYFARVAHSDSMARARPELSSKVSSVDLYGGF